MTRPMQYLDMLIPQPPGAGAEDSWTWATVTSTQPPRIRLDGEIDPVPGSPETLSGPLLPGDRVWVQLRGRRAIIHGKSQPFITPGWQPLRWMPPFTQYAGWAEPQARRTSAGIVKLVGLGTYGSGTTVPGNMTKIVEPLPVGFRPHCLLRFMVPGANNTAAATIDVYPDGNVYFQQTASANLSFLALDGIVFPAADVAPDAVWSPLTFENGWAGRSMPTWPTPGYWKDSLGRVWLRGLIQRAAGAPATESRMFTIPRELGPNQQVHALAASGNASYYYASLHFKRDSDGAGFYWKGTTGSSSLISLCGLYVHPVADLPEANWSPITLANGWTRYNTGYADASYYEFADGLVFCRGLIKGGTAPYITITANLPVDDVGDFNAMAMTSSNYAASRLSQQAGSGYLTIVADTGSTVWLCLDGLFWIRKD